MRATSFEAEAPVSLAPTKYNASTNSTFENSSHVVLSPAALAAAETARSFEDFKRLRVFHFVHHFCGTAPFGLGEAIIEEAHSRGLAATHTSLDKGETTSIC
jgi:hypothetical protein